MAVTITPFNPGQPYLPWEQATQNLDLMSQTRNRNIQNQYLPENLRIGNALKQNELNFAPGMSAAELKLKQQMAPYYGALTGEAGARTREINQKVEYPNIGSEGALGEISHGRWLKEHHPDIYVENMKNIPGTPDKESSLDTQVPGLPQLLNGKGVGIPTNVNQQRPQGLQNFNIPQMSPFVPKAYTPGTPATQQMTQQPLGQSLIKSGMDLAQAKPQMYANRGMGGAGGVGLKEQKFFESLVNRDNPGLTPDQAYEASNVLAQGGNQLSDGTPVKLTPASQASLDRLTKAGTTSTLVTKAVTANQASAELDAMEPMISKDFAPYAETYAGYSPQQIADTFKKDKASQVRMGNFIASQAGQYELAQLRNRIAAGEPGIAATEELMNKSGQLIKTMFPKASAEARAQASKRLNEYLKEGLRARNAQGINAGQLRTATAKAQAGEGEAKTYNYETGKIE